MAETLSIPSRFNGPLENGNGGYSAGLAAALVDGVGEVSLRQPVPLDSALEVVHGDGGSVQVCGGGDVVMEARPVAGVDVEVPAPVGLAEAREASARYRGPAEGLFSRCFVCGREREDSFGVFAGEVEGRDVVASPWTPPGWTADPSGHVRPEFIWAVLDCPTYFAVYLRQELRLSFLARLTARISSPVPAGEEHVVIAWPLGRDGRKLHAGAAVLSADGEPLAVARALLVEPRE